MNLITLTLTASDQVIQVMETAVIGRKTPADIIVEDPTVSGKHATISIEGERAFIDDLGSTNGVFVNDSQINVITEIRNGHTVALGEKVFSVRINYHADKTVFMTPPKPTLALVAHNVKKEEMRSFALRNKEKLLGFNLIATSTTGGILADEGFKVERLRSGPEGGDAQIASRISEGRCQALIFIRDPMNAHPHEPDIATLTRSCDVHNIPYATNTASAALIITQLEL